MLVAVELLWDGRKASPAMGSDGQWELRRGVVAVQEAKERLGTLRRKLGCWRMFLDRQSALWFKRQ